MYSLHDFARMTADGVRIRSYVRALEATIRPGCVVADIGTGTGIFALVACRLGARRVFAIDTNEAIEVARELARENGCADRIEFIQDDALAVKLPELADVVISDLRGGMPLGPGNLAVVAHAREHFLAPAGALIPLRDLLEVAVVDCAPLHDRSVGPASAGGVSLKAMRSRLTNVVHRDRSRTIQPLDLVTPGASWATVDYSIARPEPVHGHAAWRVGRSRTGHGLVLWFDAVLASDIGFSTRPGADVVYPQLFLPWSEPLALQEGDTVEVELWAQPEGDCWGWNTTVARADGGRRAEYKQSSFLAELTRPRVTTSRVLGDRGDSS